MVIIEINKQVELPVPRAVLQSGELELPTTHCSGRRTPMASTSTRGGQQTPLWAMAAAALLMIMRAGSSKHARQEHAWQATTKGARESHASESHSSESHASGPRASKSDRGRTAAGPSDIPAKGWKDIAIRVYQGLSEDRILILAAGVTFYVLLALFPGIAGLIALYGLYADPGTISQHLDMLEGVFPEGGLQIIREQIDRLTSQPAQRLGLATFIGLGISLWSANGGMKGMFDALNVIYHEKEKRSFIRLNALSLAFTLGLIVFVLLTLAALTIVPLALSYLGLSRVTELLFRFGRWPVLLVVVSLMIALIYRYGPNRDKPQWRWITPGSTFAAISWLGGSALFSWYTENFGSYNATYGSLGAVIGFMTWLWLSNIVILVGAKINAELEHQTAQDTTVDRPEPLGQRGAAMADTVGAAQV
jgi:membrane protein